MELAESSAPVGSTVADVYEHFHSFDFLADQQFMNGWKAIETKIQPADRGDRLLKAKIFYYSKFHHQVTVNEYKEWCQKKDSKKETIHQHTESGDSTNLKSMQDSSVNQTSTKNNVEEDQPGTNKSEQITTNPDEVSSLNPSMNKLSIDTDSTNESSADIMDKERPLSFAEIMELVQSGKPIPGVEALNIKPTNQQPTESTLPRVLKPWEKQAQNT